MKNQLPDKDSVNENGYSPEQILTNWLEATANFNLGYHRLIAYVRQSIAEHDFRTVNKKYIGQCPLGQLLMMVIRMRRELEKLTHDLEQEDRFTKLSAKKNYKRLATHTLRLNRLNYQAQLRLNLGRLSTS